MFRLVYLQVKELNLFCTSVTAGVLNVLAVKKPVYTY